MKDHWSSFGTDLLLELDSATGRRVGLEQALRGAIRGGRLAPDARLPATRKLASELSLSRGTVKAAYDQLVAEGYLTARQGSGTVVARLHQCAGRGSTEVATGVRSGVATGAATGVATGVRAGGRAVAGSATVPDAVGSVRFDLRPGSPDVSAFPAAAWLRATRRALNTAPADAFGYGDPRGSIELRTALAGYLGRTRGVLAGPERIVVTSGYVQALALLTRVLDTAVDGGCTTAMEDPGLEYHREVVRRAGAAVVPLPVDERGARTDLLSAAGFPRVDAVVVTPAHQYPSGVTLDPPRRRTLIDWARAGGGLVIEDDYDGEFRYDRQPVGAVQGMAPDQVVYLGTASKTLGPALRLGWMVLPARLVEPVVEAKLHHDHHTELIGQLALADLIAAHDYDRQVRAGRLRYRRRRDLLLQRIGGRFPVQGIAAGLHALVGLPEGGPGEQDVLRRAAARRLAVGRLGDHWHRPGDHPQGIIVGYGTPPERGYPAALDALVDALHG